LYLLPLDPRPQQMVFDRSNLRPVAAIVLLGCVLAGSAYFASGIAQAEAQALRRQLFPARGSFVPSINVTRAPKDVRWQLATTGSGPSTRKVLER
jgi:hypothetical protein